MILAGRYKTPTKPSSSTLQKTSQKSGNTSILNLEVFTNPQTLRSVPHEQAYYVLLNPTATDELATSRMPLNLCLLVDRSTSMRGERLRQVKSAIGHILNRLQPEDNLSLVVFSDRAEVLLRSQRVTDPALIRSIVSTIRPSGGTEILPGLEASLEEIKRNRGEASINHLILLTDGHTYGDEEKCLEKGAWASENQIQFSAIGLGHDWNEDFLDTLAALSGGTSIFIDTPDKIENIFDETISSLEKAIARDLTVKLDLHDKIYLHEAHQISPHISRLEAHDNNVALGLLSTEQEKTILLEFRVQKLPPGEHKLMRITVEADIPNQVQGRSWEWIEVKTNVSEAPELNTQVQTEVKVALKKLAVFKMQEQITGYLKAGDVARATQRLQIMATRLLDLGETSLAHAALLEAGQLAQTGVLSAEGSKRIRYGTRKLSIGQTQPDVSHP